VPPTGPPDNTNYTILSIEDLWDGTYLITYVPFVQNPSVIYSIPVTINGIAADGTSFDPVQMCRCPSWLSLPLAIGYRLRRWEYPLVVVSWPNWRVLR